MYEYHKTMQTIAGTKTEISIDIYLYKDGISSKWGGVGFSERAIALYFSVYTSTLCLYFTPHVMYTVYVSCVHMYTCMYVASPHIFNTSISSVLYSRTSTAVFLYSFWSRAFNIAMVNVQFFFKPQERKLRVAWQVMDNTRSARTNTVGRALYMPMTHRYVRILVCTVCFWVKHLNKSVPDQWTTSCNNRFRRRMKPQEQKNYELLGK